MKNPLAGHGLHRLTRQGLRHDRDAARAECLRLDGIIRGLDSRVVELEGQNAQLRADAVDVSVERQLREQAEGRIAELTARLRAHDAADANEHRVDVPPVHRDADPDPDETTQAIPLWQRELQETS